MEICYTLIRKNVKNINLSVKPDGTVVVSANPSVPEDYINAFVQSQIPFIQKARAKLQQSGQQAKKQFVSGEELPYLGDFVYLKVEAANRLLIPVWIAGVQEGRITDFSRNDQGEAVFYKDGQLWMYTAHMENYAYKEQLYETWQKIQTGVLCQKISRKYFPVFEKMGVSYPEIKIRKMSSRWGSCIPAKHKITFNSLLLEKPLESIEYVVVHEFAHFIHPNHSKAFYHLVGQILPDYKARKTGLANE